MKDRIEQFLNDLDETLAKVANGRVLKLYPIGRSAMVLAYNSMATTQDIDILHSGPEKGSLGEIALNVFGKE